LLSNDLNPTGDGQIFIEVELNHMFFKTKSEKEQREIHVNEALRVPYLIKDKLKEYDYVFVGISMEFDDAMSIPILIVATSDVVEFIKHKEKIEQYQKMMDELFQISIRQSKSRYSSSIL
jgi:hypothetical protein